MRVTEITAGSALTRSRIAGVDWVVNPYIGCGHGCRYCYADFMRRFSRCDADSPWGSFVEVKVNLPELLRDELSRKRKRGTVFFSSVCDPYQPIEARYGLIRRSLGVLLEFGWGIDILTRSPLVARDIELLRRGPHVSVGLSIPTDDESVRRIVEPHAPTIPARLAALRELHAQGIATWVFIAPMLPLDPQKLYEAVAPFADRVLIDRLNYRDRVRSLFLRTGWGHALTDAYADETQERLLALFAEKARVAGGGEA